MQSTDKPKSIQNITLSKKQMVVFFGSTTLPLVFPRRVYNFLADYKKSNLRQTYPGVI
jgi:predicted KAP-like P-loop ATPase